MSSIYVDPITGNTYEEQITSTKTLPDRTVVTNSTWVLIETSEIKKKVGRPSKKK